MAESTWVNWVMTLLIEVITPLYWLFHRNPYFMASYNPYITGDPDFIRKQKTANNRGFWSLLCIYSCHSSSEGINQYTYSRTKGAHVKFTQFKRILYAMSIKINKKPWTTLSKACFKMNWFTKISMYLEYVRILTTEPESEEISVPSGTLSFTFEPSEKKIAAKFTSPTCCEPLSSVCIFGRQWNMPCVTVL